MKITSYAVGRPNYYDRGAAGLSTRYLATVSPHVQTTRWTITIASGQKGFAEMGGVRITGVTAPGTAGFAMAGIDTFAGGVYSTLIFQRMTTSATLPILYEAYPVSVSLYPGDELLGFTQDSSTGGTVQFIVDSKITTFTA